MIKFSLGVNIRHSERLWRFLPRVSTGPRPTGSQLESHPTSIVCPLSRISKYPIIGVEIRLTCVFCKNTTGSVFRRRTRLRFGFRTHQLRYQSMWTKVFYSISIPFRSSLCWTWSDSATLLDRPAVAKWMIWIFKYREPYPFSLMHRLFVSARGCPWAYHSSSRCQHCKAGKFYSVLHWLSKATESGWANFNIHDPRQFLDETPCSHYDVTNSPISPNVGHVIRGFRG